MVLSHLFPTFAHMKSNVDNKTAPLSEEQAFRQKADSYLVCFLDHCPQRSQCLRWLVGQYVSERPYAWTAISPRHPQAATESCEMFRKNVRIVMKRGFKNLYREMPAYKERAIRQQLIHLWGRRQYFEMRKGDRLITPEQQQDIINVCKFHGYSGPIVYDGEQEDWLW